MPLRYSGQSAPTVDFEIVLEAFDGPKRVLVVTSEEAIQDYGLAAVQVCGSRKYDAGQIEPGPVPRVRVFTSDLR